MCLVALGKWGAGRSQSHIWTNFTNHFFIMFDFYKSLIYTIKSIVVITRMIAHCFHCYINTYIIYIYIYIYIYERWNIIYIYRYNIYIYTHNMCIYYLFLVCIYMYLLRLAWFFEIWALCVFLQPTLFFHINALRGEINPQFFKIV